MMLFKLQIGYLFPKSQQFLKEDWWKIPVYSITEANTFMSDYTA